eukprot:scaffold15777_cov69-Skeletonema_marinoi.AAC.2
MLGRGCSVADTWGIMVSFALRGEISSPSTAAVFTVNLPFFFTFIGEESPSSVAVDNTNGDEAVEVSRCALGGDRGTPGSASSPDATAL